MGSEKRSKPFLTYADNKTSDDLRERSERRAGAVVILAVYDGLDRTGPNESFCSVRRLGNFFCAGPFLRAFEKTWC